MAAYLSSIALPFSSCSSLSFHTLPFTTPRLKPFRIRRIILFWPSMCTGFPLSSIVNCNKSLPSAVCEKKYIGAAPLMSRMNVLYSRSKSSSVCSFDASFCVRDSLRSARSTIPRRYVDVSAPCVSPAFISFSVLENNCSIASMSRIG